MPTTHPPYREQHYGTAVAQCRRDAVNSDRLASPNGFVDESRRTVARVVADNPRCIG